MLTCCKWNKFNDFSIPYSAKGYVQCVLCNVLCMFVTRRFLVILVHAVIQFVTVRPASGLNFFADLDDR